MEDQKHVGVFGDEEVFQAAAAPGIWTKFDDMHSGGGRKLDTEIIWIEAVESEATALFKGMFGRDPLQTICSCCGEDYWVTETRCPKIESGDTVVDARTIEQYEESWRVYLES